MVLVAAPVAAQDISIGATKDDVLKAFGDPDLITTRDDLKSLIYPKKLDLQKYADRYEFWIYLSNPKKREIRGYFEFDQDGIVVDYLINSIDQKGEYKAEAKIPEIELFQKIGKFNGDDWNLMPDKSRVLLLVETIDSFRAKNIMIKKNLFYYLEELSSFYEDPAHLGFSVINTLYCFAVLNRDWDDGTNRNERIKRLLPSDMWQEYTQ